MEEIKSKINAQFEILERSERDSKKYLINKVINKDSKAQKHVSYMEQQEDTIRDMNYEVQEMVIEIVNEWIHIMKKKMERYQEVVDRLKGYLEDLREKKEAETRKREDQMQEKRFKRRMEEKLKIE